MAEGGGQFLWRWFFGTVALGAILPILVGVVSLAAAEVPDPVLAFGRQGDLLILSVAVLGGAWSLLAGIRDRHELLADCLLFAIASLASAWAVVRTRGIEHLEVPEWLPGWAGWISLGLSAVVGLRCAILSEGRESTSASTPVSN